MAKDFAALPGVYQTLFLHIEPASTILPAILIWLFPGATWFHHELIPSPSTVDTPPRGFLDSRSTMAVWQLGNCYFLLGLLSSFVFRAVRDALPDNPRAQERILGASFAAMAIADFTHIVATIIALPSTMRWNFFAWNATTHGNITFVVLLLAMRLSWFAGVGRKTFGRQKPLSKKQ